MSKFSNFFKVAKGFVSENSPKILTAFAVGGVITTTTFAITGTIKAVDIIEEEFFQKTFQEWDANESDYPEEPTALEKLKVVWPCFIPAVGMAIVTIGCIIGSNHINQRRNAALASVYGITEAAFREYRDKVVETVGEKKELAIRDEIATDELKKHPIEDAAVVMTGYGTTLCRDSLSNQYFRSDQSVIEKAVNAFNRELNTEMFLSVNDWYGCIGLPDTVLGKYLGWDVDRGLLEPTYTSGLATNGEPCLVIKYNIVPKSPR